MRTEPPPPLSRGGFGFSSAIPRRRLPFAETGFVRALRHLRRPPANLQKHGKFASITSSLVRPTMCVALILLANAFYKVYYWLFDLCEHAFVSALLLATVFFFFLPVVFNLESVCGC